MHFTVVATFLALLTYLGLSTYVSTARGKYGVKAPAVTGNADFERVLRVQQNTLEQIVLFLPSLWMFGAYVSDLWAGLLGLVWVAGRLLYAYSYYQDAAKRGPGFIIAISASLVLLVGSLIGVFVNG